MSKSPRKLSLTKRNLIEAESQENLIAEASYPTDHNVIDYEPEGV